MKKKKYEIDYIWVLKITLVTFIISLVFSFISDNTLSNVGIIIGLIIVFLFIILGVIFDMIGVAVTTADEKQFHSMSSRRVRGAKTAVFLKKNADKVSSFCNDVIGDICGIISGSAGVVIALKISNYLNVSSLIPSLLFTSLIASFTIGGKALGKNLAISNGNQILFIFAKVLSFFKGDK